MGERSFVGGHGPVDAHGAPCPPFGRVPGEVSLEDAQGAGRFAEPAVLARTASGAPRCR